MHHPTDKIAHTTAFVTPVVEHWLEREIAKYRTRQIKATETSKFVISLLHEYMHFERP